MEPQFRILGPIEVAAAAGGSRHIPRGRTLSLLALLLLHRGAVVPFDRALDELWESARPTGGRKAVHVVASRLRSALGEGVLRSQGGGYALRLAAGELDADQFEGLVRYGRAELGAGEPWEAAATLRRALQLWRGPALAMAVVDARAKSDECPRACARHEARVIDFVASNPGSTAGDVARALGLNRNSVATRLGQLAKSGEPVKAERGYTALEPG